MSIDHQVHPLFPEAGPSTFPSHSKPSIFELIAQDQLRDLLQPVVRYVLSYLTHRYPRYLIRVLNHHEEFYAGLMVLLEGYHLKRHDASLSEHFYGLRLVPTGGIPTPRLDSLEPSRPRRRLNRKQRFGMLLFLVGLPYLRLRAQDFYERLGGGFDSDSDSGSDQREEPAGTAIATLQKTYKLLYPYVNLALDVSLLSYDLAYLFERTPQYRPWHRWLGLTVQRKGAEEESPPGILSKLPPLLPPLLLLLKLSQWWYSPTSPRSLPLSKPKPSRHFAILPPRPMPILPSSDLTVPPLTPPHTPPPSTTSTLDPPSMKSGAGFDPKASVAGRYDVLANPDRVAVERKNYEIGVEEYGICPLCKDKWKNPAILPSGWVVCWRCGWEAVEGEDEPEEDGLTEAEIEDEERLDNVDGYGGASRDDSGHDNDDSEMRGDKGHIAEENTLINPQRKGRKGRCPITGIPVGPGQLRRVLV